MKVIFGTNIAVANLVSPVYNTTTPVCLKFFYRISLPKLKLSVFASNPTTPGKYLPAGNWTWDSQLDFHSWNSASLKLQNGVMQMMFFASKPTVTLDWSYVAVDRITLGSNIDSCDMPNLPGTLIGYSTIGCS